MTQIFFFLSEIPMDVVRTKSTYFQKIITESGYRKKISNILDGTVSLLGRGVLCRFFMPVPGSSLQATGLPVAAAGCANLKLTSKAG